MKFKDGRISKQEFIKFLINEGALRLGNFTLKSGAKSPFFINLGDICSGGALNFVGKAFAEQTKEHFGGADILFGPPYKGITLISAAAIAYHEMYHQKIYTCYNRKEAKGHGEKGMFVGRIPEKGDRIVVIDDVISTGLTKVEAIEIVEKTFNVKVGGIIVSVDRRTKNRDSALDNYKLISIVSLADIINYLQETGDPNARKLEEFYEEKYAG